MTTELMLTCAGLTGAASYRSRSMSKSRSRSRSESMSHSHSVSLSRSKSGSISRSLTKSLSESMSHSHSQSKSRSASRSKSLSESMSHSHSQSKSRSASMSMSRSLTKSLSESMSHSHSQSKSRSASMSMSRSLTKSLSESMSHSHSVSKTRSKSKSESKSHSLSHSHSRLRSMSQSRSRSESMSHSHSVTQSRSQSKSESMSHSHSHSKSRLASMSRSKSKSIAAISGLSDDFNRSDAANLGGAWSTTNGIAVKDNTAAVEQNTGSDKHEWYGTQLETADQQMTADLDTSEVYKYGTFDHRVEFMLRGEDTGCPPANCYGAQYLWHHTYVGDVGISVWKFIGGGRTYLDEDQGEGADGNGVFSVSGTTLTFTLDGDEVQATDSDLSDGRYVGVNLQSYYNGEGSGVYIRLDNWTAEDV